VRPVVVELVTVSVGRSNVVCSSVPGAEGTGTASEVGVCVTGVVGAVAAGAGVDPHETDAAAAAHTAPRKYRPLRRRVIPAPD
jgi:hypothetical protein